MKKTAYEMRISDWSSDVCSADLAVARRDQGAGGAGPAHRRQGAGGRARADRRAQQMGRGGRSLRAVQRRARGARGRSEEHTSELQSLMRISYAVFCLKKKKKI